MIKLDEEVTKILNEVDSDLLEQLKKALEADEYVKVEGTAEVSKPSWNGYDPTTYSADTVPGRFESNVYIDEDTQGKCKYSISYVYLEEYFGGLDEDGYPLIEYEETGDRQFVTSDKFDTKEDCIKAAIEYITDLGDDIDNVEIA